MPVDAFSYRRYGSKVWDRRSSRILPCGEVLDGELSWVQRYDSNEYYLEFPVDDVTVYRGNYRLGQAQFEFRPHCSREMAIATAQRLYRDEHKCVQIIYLKAALDSVPRDCILARLKPKRSSSSSLLLLAYTKASPRQESSALACVTSSWTLSSKAVGDVPTAISTRPVIACAYGLRMQSRTP